MWEELIERLKFFGEIVGNLIIDALLLSAWVIVDYLVEYILIHAIYTVGDLPLYIKYPKYTLDIAPPLVILPFVFADVIRSIKKLWNSLKK